VVSAPPTPVLTGDIVNQYLTALNAHNPDLVASLYNANAGHVTAQSTVIGAAAIRAFYVGLFAMLPDAKFTVTPTVTQDKVRMFTWSAAGSTGSVTDGSDILGLLNGRIQYHHSAFTFKAKQ